MRELRNGSIIKIICNQCGKEILVSNDIVRAGTFSVEYKWGYFSDKDGEAHGIDLCEECYDTWVQGFKVPVSVREIEI